MKIKREREKTQIKYIRHESVGQFRNGAKWDKVGGGGGVGGNSKDC